MAARADAAFRELVRRGSAPLDGHPTSGRMSEETIAFLLQCQHRERAPKHQPAQVDQTSRSASDFDILGPICTRKNRRTEVVWSFWERSCLSAATASPGFRAQAEQCLLLISTQVLMLLGNETYYTNGLFKQYKCFV